MRRTIALVSAGLLALGAAACADNTTNDPNAPGLESPGVTEEGFGDEGGLEESPQE
jgi:hypothetical protein